jgi:hypothetical protein
MAFVLRVFDTCERLALRLADAVRGGAAALADKAQPRADAVGRWARGRVAAVAVTGVAFVVMRAEIDRLVGSELAPDGTTASMREGLGPSAFGQTGAWATWRSLGPGARDVGIWLVAEGLLTGLIAVAVAIVLFWLLGASRVGCGLTAALFLVQLVQASVVTLLAVLLAAGSSVGPGGAVLGTVSTAWWVVAAALATCVLVSAPVRASLRLRLRGFATAIRYQRLSVAVVGLLGLVSTASGPNILDQVPDVQRAWVGSGGGLWDGVVALLSVFVVAVLLLAIGRRRARRAWSTFHEGGLVATGLPTGGRWVVWLLAPVLALCAAAVLSWRGVTDGVSAVVLPIFVGIPVVLVLSSLLLRDAQWLWGEPSPAADEPRAVLTRKVGDGVAVGLVAVLGLGIVRSYTAPVFADVVVARERADLLAMIAMLVLGLVLTVLSIPLGLRVVAGLDPDEKRPVKTAVRAMILRPQAVPDLPRRTRRIPLLVCLLAPLLLLAVLIDPLWFGGALGVFGLLTAVLGAWVVVLGSLVVYLQDYRPIPFFRMLHLRASPVLTVFVAVPVLATLAPSEPELHHVRTVSDQTVAPLRDSLAVRFDKWLRDGADCDVSVKRRGGGDVHVRPMLLIAGSGGGIRSAYWTASVLDRLTKVGDCASKVTLMSSGVSGGAVGLVVSRQVEEGEAVAAVHELAKPGVLAAGLSGTLVGDLVAGSVGVRVAPWHYGDHPARWLDRAGLLERQWERAVPGLAHEWSPVVQGPAGALVLNSTDARAGCRVLVSQVALRLGDRDGGLVGADQAANCQARTRQPAGSLDLFSAFGPCSPRLPWSTAAMLAARFPTVTPAGRIPRRGACEELTPDLQLVDGGYAETSGVGTLADLGPQLAALVRDHNATVGAGGAYVVPLVAYFEDEVRSDVVVRPPRQAAELLVPLAGRKAKAHLSVTSSQLQRVARAFADPCPGRAPAPCDAAVDGVHRGIPDGVLLVAPPTTPSVTAPLGWTLSPDSERQLRNALEAQACNAPARAGRYAGLAALLSLLGEPASTRCGSGDH